MVSHAVSLQWNEAFEQGHMFWLHFWDMCETIFWHYFRSLQKQIVFLYVSWR